MRRSAGAQGAGAVAMLLGRDPALQILRDSVTCMKNTNDFFKPRYSKQLSPCMRPRESMDNYLASLDYCAERTRERFGADLATADAVAIHGGLCRSVVTKAMRHWLTTHGPSSLKARSSEARFLSSSDGDDGSNLTESGLLPSQRARKLCISMRLCAPVIKPAPFFPFSISTFI